MGGSDGVAIVAVVKGMTFALVQVISLEALGKARATGIIPETDGKPAIDMFYVYFLSDECEDGHVVIRSRMFFEGRTEDPATGSGASALCGFLSMVKDGNDLENLDKYHITQGVEMGRKSDIRVDVKTRRGPREGDRREVETMWLSGRCVQVMQGTLSV